MGKQGRRKMVIYRRTLSSVLLILVVDLTRRCRQLRRPERRRFWFRSRRMENTGSNCEVQVDQRDGLFPEEIIIEILLRLPVKSLCRFRCVSPLWRSLIGDPHLVSSHLARSAARPRLLMCVDRFEWARRRLVLMGGLRRKGRLFFSTDDPERSEDPRLAACYHGNITTMGCYVSHSVGGLICVSDKDRLQVFNPTTGESITLRRSTTYFNQYFLGYDPIEKKHKIVDSSASILTLGEKEWRRLDPGIAGLYLRDSLCVDGVMYMVGVIKNDKGLLISFDVRQESFRSVPFPASFSYHVGMQLTEFGGRVALLDLSMVFIDNQIRLWIWEDLHKQIMSCRKFPLPPDLVDVVDDQGPHYVVAGTQAGEVVFARSRIMAPWFLYLHNLENNSLRKIEIGGLCEPRLSAIEGGCLSMVCYHVESPQSLRDFQFDL